MAEDAPQKLTDAELQAKFNEIDTDGNGSLSREELERFCNSLPTPPTEAEVNKIFRHMDVDGDGKITFAEFHEWWASKSNNLLPLLYVKQRATKALNKATGHVTEALKDSNQGENHANLKKFEVSFKAGDAPSNTEVELKVTTHVQAQANSAAVRQALGLSETDAAVVLKLTVNPDTQAEAKQQLTDLVDQAKSIAEVMLPPEVAELYLSMVEIKVETFSTNHLLLSVSSNHPMVGGILATYEGLLEQFRVTDQSVVLDVKFGSSLNLETAVTSETAADAIKGAVSGVEASVSIEAAKSVIENLRVLASLSLNTGRSKDKFILGIANTLLNGFSVAVKSEDVTTLVPEDLAQLPVAALVAQLKNLGSPQEILESLPVAQDFVTFLKTHAEPRLATLVLVPNILVEFSARVEGVAAVWEQLLN